MKLKIAAKIDAVDREYVEKEVGSLLEHPLVEFIGECGGRREGKVSRGYRKSRFRSTRPYLIGPQFTWPRCSPIDKKE
jgi:hypothetical protein